MPKILALAGILLIGSIAAIALAGRAAPGSAAAPVVSSVAPEATADPLDTSRVDARSSFGRLGSDERIRRARIVVSGLSLPIDGVGLPDDPDLLPNAPREYRGGWHEGIDFPAPSGTPVHAVAAGTIVRVDHDYQDWDRESERVALLDAVELGYTPATTLDLIRGRQVWIDHGHGVVSRYAHLSAVSDLIVGASVEAREVIGAVGSSGYPEGGPHLHLEIRMGTSYLGDGLEGDALTTAVAEAFD